MTNCVSLVAPLIRMHAERVSAAEALTRVPKRIVRVSALLLWISSSVVVCQAMTAPTADKWHTFIAIRNANSFPTYPNLTSHAGVSPVETKRRAFLAVLGGIFCAVAGSLLAGLAVALIGIIRGRPEDITRTGALFFMAFVFAAIPGAPFGFIVGLFGSWWLAPRVARSVSASRIALESAGIGAFLGATFPLIATVLGWGPFRNLVSVLPVCIGIGILCGVTLALLMRKYLLHLQLN